MSEQLEFAYEQDNIISLLDDAYEQERNNREYMYRTLEYKAAIRQAVLHNIIEYKYLAS